MRDNPKDAIGRTKPSVRGIPFETLFDIGLAFRDGVNKYGIYNYKISHVSKSVYVDALIRHLEADISGEVIDPVSGATHISHCIANLMIIASARLSGTLIEDMFPDVAPKLTEKDDLP